MKAVHVSLLLVSSIVATDPTEFDLIGRQPPQIPSYVIDYAPLVYIDVNDYYLPSDIGYHLTKTFPALNFNKTTSGPSRPSLNNLSRVNKAGNCSFSSFGDCGIYLTTKRNECAYPAFFNGTLPDPKTGETQGARSCAVIVNDRGDGIVDAFYMYFYSFNLGDTVLGYLLGNHVGDWEHNMIRFKNGKPATIWFSQHDGGETYTYKAVSKKNGRPIAYSGRGTHANYAVPGLHVRKVVVNVKDYSSAGPLWDPVRSAYFYTFEPSNSSTKVNNGTFRGAMSTGCGSNGISPTDWLLYYGRWGNKQLPDSDPCQDNLAEVAYTWEDGPTGPYDKDLNRNGTCPDGEQPCSTTTVLPSVSGNPSPRTTISRATPTLSSCHSTASGPHPTGGGNNAPSLFKSRCVSDTIISTLLGYYLLI